MILVPKKQNLKEGGMMRILILGLMMALIASCGEKQEQNLTGGKLSGFSVYQVVDSLGSGVAGAKVLVGTEYDETKIYTSDENGNVEIPAQILSNSNAFTIDADGFVRASYLGLSATQKTLQLNPKTFSRNYGVKGVTTGFGSLKKDKWADFSMVAPIFTRSQLIGFELSYVISDQMDIMTVYGQDISIPSNISFPKQKENYGFFPVTLNKPSYRMPFFFPGTYEIAALHGRFPFKKVVGKMRDGKSVFEVVNDFELKQIGITTMEISGPDHEKDLPINQIAFDEVRDFTAPNFDKNDILLLISLNERGGKYFPSSLKKVSSEEKFSLNFAKDYGHHMLAVLTQETKSSAAQASLSAEMSIQVLPLNQSQPVQLLSKIQKPEETETGLKLYPPAEILGVQQGGTYLSLGTVADKHNPHVELVDNQKMWEVYAPAWVEEIALPQWPTRLSSQNPLRWEVMFLGTENSSTSELGPTQIERASHVTRNTLDI